MTTLEAWAEKEKAVRDILGDKSLGHSHAARVLNAANISSSESAVRRYRQKHGIKLTPPAPDLNKAVAPVVIEDESPEVTELRKQLNKLGKDLEKTKDDKKLYVNAVLTATREAFGKYALFSETSLAPRPAIPDEEVAVALLSDTQIGKTTTRGTERQYDSEVARRRINEYAEKIISITHTQRADHPVNKVVVPVLGDIVEGEEIFPGQMWRIDGGLYRQLVNGVTILTSFLDRMLDEFNEVEVIWVIGNHGRIGGVSARSHDPETNADRILGKMVQLAYEGNPRITFNIPEGPNERNWYAVARVGNYTALCCHGDQFKGQNGMPWYSIQKKVNAWAAGALDEEFRDVYCGHHHQTSLIPLNKRNVYVNGTTESYNTYAQEDLGASGDPSQWLLFVHPERGVVTAQYVVRLEHVR